MKYILFLIAFFSIQGLRAQEAKADWPALETFHEVMAMTFHPSEEGNLEPIKARSGELASKAKALKDSAIPASMQKPGVAESLKLLAKEAKALDKMVKKHKSDVEITKSLAALHDRFHEVVEKCHH